MPPITLWATLAVCASFAVFFTAGTIVALLERLRAARIPGETVPPLRVLLRSAALAAVAWFAVYRVFLPA
ncbi:MAG TPA: hypothetical protein VLS49_04185 [Usitatibacter sp.]|nr:hypothetical protein [Usitatibacter sp.]